MENIKIPVLENFALISKILPFYGYTHKSFLLLSVLWVKTREKLDEYYDEFRKFMMRYRITIVINQKNMSRLQLPSDLFKFSIKVNENNIDEFEEFIDRMHNRDGCFFNNHYMNEFYQWDDIVVSSNIFKRLSICAEKMKHIRILNDNITDCKFKRETFADIIVLDSVENIDSLANILWKNQYSF